MPEILSMLNSLRLTIAKILNTIKRVKIAAISNILLSYHATDSVKVLDTTAVLISLCSKFN